jgi:hypothetical protein
MFIVVIEEVVHGVLGGTTQPLHSVSGQGRVFPSTVLMGTICQPLVLLIQDIKDTAKI